MNKTRYSATEFGGNKPMNFRPSGTLSQQEFSFGSFVALSAERKDVILQKKYENPRKYQI